MARWPDLTRAYAGGLDGALRERVMVAVSRVNSCSGCARVHRRWALRSGVSSEELEALEDGDLGPLDARSRAAVTYAVELAERGFETSACRQTRKAAQEHLGEHELRMVEAVARAMTLANLSLSTLEALPCGRAMGREEHPVFARCWSRISGKAVSRREREELLAGLRGRVLEIGAGDGRNFVHYPSGVDEVLAIEPEPYLRRLACEAAPAAPVPITVLDGTAELLPLEDATCDAVVSSLVLCSVSDQRSALGEAHRVLAPRGELRFYEHVTAAQGAGRALQTGLDASGIWPRLGAGCHLNRDTVSAIEAAGFELERMRRFTSGPGRLGIPFVLGTARRAG
jgi:AhpD family alkylhydroperoxidase